MGQKMTVNYEGGFKAKIHNKVSGEVVMDLPLALGGTETAFAPTDFVALALATCILETMEFVAKRKGVDLAGARADVVKEMKEKPQMAIAKVSLEFSMPAGIAEQMRPALEAAARACPVHNSLSRDIQYDIKFNYA